jgi:alpha-amylase
MLLVYTLFVLVSFLVLFISAADTSAWKSRSIYFVLTDRIARSINDAGGNACGNLGTYCGGTFEGLESKLDYIKGLGFDAIWITPVVASKLVISLGDATKCTDHDKRFSWWLSWILGAGFVHH